MSLLDAMLKQAAEADWKRVVQRCAWCGRVADASGRYVPAPRVFESGTVFSDGMCPPCGRRALAAITRRGHLTAAA